MTTFLAFPFSGIVILALRLFSCASLSSFSFFLAVIEVAGSIHGSGGGCTSAGSNVGRPRMLRCYQEGKEIRGCTMQLTLARV